MEPGVGIKHMFRHFLPGFPMEAVQICATHGVDDI